MATKKAAAKASTAPAPFPTITIADKTYRLDFSLPALANAERAFLQQGINVNLLFALAVSTLNLNRLRDLFAAALWTHQPEIGYAAGVDMVTAVNIYEIANFAMDALGQKQKAA